MIQLSSIKERLKNFNDTEFQELCDSFLGLRHRGYKAYARSGAHNIKQKTTIGTPDSFFLMPNGRYLFIESTTIAHKGNQLLDKLKQDISNCLNKKKTGIPVNKIQEIILCYNSNLTAHQLEEVNKEAIEVMGKLPTHNSLNSLAHELFFHHKNLVHHYLKLPLDTGQVILLEKFIEEYDNGKQKLATPLAGKFLHRVEELKKVQQNLNSNDIVIISGASGVGKSKLALQAIKEFLELNLNYNAYAISPKGADILDDLRSYFDTKENSILFVDDVNRFDKFEQILGFYGELKKGKLKLILTVRDYALENVRDWLALYKSSIIKVKGFNDEEIKTILQAKPYEIFNDIYQRKICSIAKGNARLAVMMAIIAKKTNTLDLFNDVSDLFEQYFRTFTYDKDSFKDKRVLKALGILSFFYTLPYNDNEILDSVSNAFSISSDELREAFDVLHNLDFIELNYHHVRIGEQNLSTYYFYKVFIKDKLLSFDSLWRNYFNSHQQRFRDTLYPIFQNFNKDFFISQIKPVLLSYWLNIDSEKSEIRFLKFSWEFIPNECLTHINSIIEKKEYSKVTELKVTYERNEFTSTSNREVYLDLLANFFKDQEYSLEAIDTSFGLIEREPRHLSQLIYRIDQNFYFSEEDYNCQFRRQSDLIDYLITNLNKGELYKLSFLTISKTILRALHWEDKEKAPKEVSRSSVKQIRHKIIKTILSLYEIFPRECYNIIFDFSIESTRYSTDTTKFDLTYLIPWIDANLDKNNFQHCYYIQELIRACIKKKYIHDDFKRLKLSFEHPTYKIFELVNWSRKRAKDSYDFDNYKEFEQLKKIEIEENLTFTSKNEIKSFFQRYIKILEWDKINLYSQHYVINIIITSNLKNDKEIGFITFLEFARLRDKGTFNSEVFVSYVATDEFTIDLELTERFWKIIDSEKLNQKWKIDILTSLHEKDISEEYLLRLYTFFSNTNVDFGIDHKRLQKYEKLDSDFFLKIIRFTVEKIEKENLKIWIYEDSFIEISKSIKDIKLLKKAYIQQGKIDSHFDHSGEALLMILKSDSYFLLELVKETLKDKDYIYKSEEKKALSIVWELPNPTDVMNEIVEYAINIDDYYFAMDHFLNTFFKRLNSNIKKADDYLIYLIKIYHSQPKIIDIVFNIIYKSRKELFERAFIVYIRKNQNLENFKKIQWLDRQIIYSGDAIVGAIKAGKWERLLNLIEKTNLGMKTLSIKRYIRQKIDDQLQKAEYEKKRKFINKF
ncbi:hypothetical protein U8527_09790 [Kordia algicida OT-1]|uniref:Novel STAND NTPase 3 domain-containing protein n=1 Tax=Kordia algicida OT-1 TaxID=391587 RepID=A9DV94_9FLAO|nr:hypothetical protein [Kordia algicida]EDP96391.1 hypothetical protein KAOT1_03242 [Kordia algicida OT-1]